MIAAVSDLAGIVGLTVLGASPVVVGCWFLGRRLSGAGARAQILLVVLGPLMATWVGALVAARLMFISTHDLAVVVTIAGTGAIIGVGAAWLVARRVRRDAAALTAWSESVASGEPADRIPQTALAEMRGLADALLATSDELAAAHARELALETSRRELVAWVSHDLRSPLAAIRAMAEALEDGVVDQPDDVRRYLRSIGSETDALASLVNDLFELSRISSGLVELDPRPIEVGQLLAEVVDGLRAASRTRDVELVVEVDEGLVARVSPTEAMRVVRNLVDNAIRHTPAGDVVQISATSVDSMVEVSVVDACGGIPATDLDRVFDVAFRGDPARARDGGAGLGLAIARSLTEAQDGSIAVSNHPGGCCFSVRFPLVRL